MSSNNWEKVANGKSKKKSQNRQETPRMPTQHVEVEPLMVKSMFQAIDAKPKNEVKQPLQDRSNMQASPKGRNKTKKPKKPAASSGFKHRTFEEAIQDVDVKTVYDKAKELRATQKVWQKSIISMINDIISCPEESPTFSNKDFKYPLSKVPKATYNMLKKLFVEETTEAMKTVLFDYSMNCMLDLMSKVQPIWGFRLCIQILSHHSPNSCFEESEKYLDEISLMKNYPKRCHTYMWALGQVGAGKLRSGMTVWLDVMLPLLGTKNLAQYVVHYLETLLKFSSNPRKDLSGTIDADQFIEIMKWTFDPTTGLSINLRERLRSTYSTVRLIATADADQKLAIFQRFLKTPVDEIMRVRGQFLDVAFESMRENPKCLQSWSDRLTYSSSLPQTKLLLEYMESKWVEIARLLPKNFEQTIRTLDDINTAAAAQSDNMTSIKEFKSVKSLCRDFLQKLKKKSQQSRFRYINVLLIFCIALIAVGLLWYDVNLHGGKIENSWVYRSLENSGTLSILKKVQERLSAVLQIITEWFQANVPFYVSRVSDVLGPYLYYFVSLVGSFIQWIAEITAPLREAIITNAEAILVWADGMLLRLIPGARSAFEGMMPYLTSFSKWLDVKALAIYSFLKGEIGWCCVRDAVVELVVFFYLRAYNVLAVIWSYLLYLFKVVSDYVSGENME